MGEYSELIKKFDQVRDVMRDFYVYGFQSREQIQQSLGTSGRSYDNQRRRIESYLADYMAFQQDKDGKRIFLSVDSASIAENPLYRAFKAKSFTRNDLNLHFMILELLKNGVELTATQMVERMDELADQEEAGEPMDLSTLRKKLKEYEGLGLLQTRKDGKQLYYSLVSELSVLEQMNAEERSQYRDALRFFAETTPLGVIGSYLLDREDAASVSEAVAFGWKHHYIMHALESQVVCELLDAIRQGVQVEVMNHSAKTGKDAKLSLLPLRILISVQSGRRYVAGYDYRNRSIRSYRLDYIKEVKLGQPDKRIGDFQERLDYLLEHTWGVAISNTRRLETLSMTVEVLPGEQHIVERLQREGRHGTVTQLDENHWKYEIRVWDASEMIPWLRTFLGRITELNCSNGQVTKRFYEDMDSMFFMYGVHDPENPAEGGESDALS